MYLLFGDKWLQLSHRKYLISPALFYAMGMDAKEKIISLLRSIGLNQYEAQAYASLLLYGSATAGELSSRAGVPRPRVYDIINRLEKKGFVFVEPGRPVKYRAVPPREAIEAYLRMKQEEFNKEYERIRAVAEQLERARETKRRDEKESGVWVLNSENILRTSIENAVSNAERSVIVTLNPEFIDEYGNTLFPALEAAANKGVGVTVLLPRDLRGAVTVAGDVEVIETEGEVPPTIIVDDKKAIMAIPGDRKAIMVDHPMFTRSLKSMIERNMLL